MSDTKLYSLIVDAKEDRCPMPLLKLKLALAGMSSGETVCVYAKDAGSKRDIPHFLQLVGLPLIDSGVEDGAYFFVTSKKES